MGGPLVSALLEKRPRRLLFVRPRSAAPMAPIYLAILLLVLLSLAGFAVALRHHEPQPQAYPSDAGETATPAARLTEGDLRVLPEAFERSRRGTWM